MGMKKLLYLAESLRRDTAEDGMHVILDHPVKRDLTGEYTREGGKQRKAESRIMYVPVARAGRDHTGLPRA